MYSIQKSTPEGTTKQTSIIEEAKRDRKIGNFFIACQKYFIDPTRNRFIPFPIPHSKCNLVIALA
jgi:hypothetical protein